MADIPKELVESELFGHEKGSFTGAVDKRIGRFEQANGGTLFLDEIGDMPLESQTRLLRVLSNKEFYRVGGDKPIKVDVRIIAATHQNLENLVFEKKIKTTISLLTMKKEIKSNFFNKKDIDYTEIMIDQDPSLIAEMVEKSGRQSVPQIFIGDYHVGGFDDLVEHDMDGKLEDLLT